MVKLHTLITFIIFLFFFGCASKSLNEYNLDGSYESTDVDFNNALKHFKNEKYMRAKEEFRSIINNPYLSNFSFESQFYIGQCDYYLKDYNQAIIEYENYLNVSYQRTSFVEIAELNLCRCYYNITLDYKKDQSSTYRALEKLQYYIEKDRMNNYINEIEEMIKNLRNKLAQKDFETAKLYIRLNENNAAEIYFNNILNKFYDSDYLNDALINLSLLKYIESKNNSLYFLENNKNNFNSESEFNEVVFFINSLQENQEEKYYIKQMK